MPESITLEKWELAIPAALFFATALALAFLAFRNSRLAAERDGYKANAAKSQKGRDFEAALLAKSEKESAARADKIRELDRKLADWKVGHDELVGQKNELIECGKRRLAEIERLQALVDAGQKDSRKIESLESQLRGALEKAASDRRVSRHLVEQIRRFWNCTKSCVAADVEGEDHARAAEPPADPRGYADRP